MVYRQTFTVEGCGTFPFDMLRYDHCWPAKEGDASQFDNNTLIREDAYFKQQRQVRLARDVDTKGATPAVPRWKSFGWDVLSDTIETKKRS